MSKKLNKMIILLEDYGLNDYDITDIIDLIVLRKNCPTTKKTIKDRYKMEEKQKKQAIKQQRRSNQQMAVEMKQRPLGFASDWGEDDEQKTKKEAV